MMMMHMTLYWSKNVTLLVNSWKTDSWTSYSLTLLAIFLCSVIYQNMEQQRLRFKSLSSSSSSSSSSITSHHRTSSPPSIDGTTANTRPLLFKLRRGGRSRWVNPVRVTSAVLFGVNSAIGYLLMLAVMSFNGGVFVAVVLGFSVGYFFFRSGGGEDDDNDDDVTDVENNACACS